MTKDQLIAKWEEERSKATHAAMSSIGCSSDDARAAAIRECIEDLRDLEIPTDAERLQNALGTLWDIAHFCEDGLNPIELADWAIGQDFKLQEKAKAGGK